MFASFVAALSFVSILASVVGIGGGINAPAVSVAPAPLTFTVSVDKPESLLYLSVAASTEDVRQTRSELIDLQKHPGRSHVVTWPGLPPGRYLVVASVVDRSSRSTLIDSVSVVRK